MVGEIVNEMVEAVEKGGFVIGWGKMGSVSFSYRMLNMWRNEKQLNYRKMHMLACIKSKLEIFGIMAIRWIVYK